VWALSEAYVLLGLRSYLEWFGKFSSGGQHTRLGAHHTLSDVTFLTHHHKFSHSIFLQFLHFILCVCLFSFYFLLLLGFTHNHEYGASFGRPWPPLMLTLCPVSIPQLHLILTITCFSSLPLWSEPSHLLNYLVKFVSIGNLP